MNHKRKYLHRYQLDVLAKMYDRDKSPEFCAGLHFLLNDIDEMHIKSKVLGVPIDIKTADGGVLEVYGSEKIPIKVVVRSNIVECILSDVKLEYFNEI